MNQTQEEQFIINYLKKLGFEKTIFSATYILKNLIICNRTIVISIQTYGKNFIIEGDVEQPATIYPDLYLMTQDIEKIYKAIIKWLLTIHTEYVIRRL